MFAASIAVNALLLSFLVMASAGPLFPGGEHWLSIAIPWALSAPLAIVLSILCLRFYPRYIQSSSAGQRVLTYVSLVAAVAAAAPMITSVLLFAGFSVYGAISRQ